MVLILDFRTKILILISIFLLIKCSDPSSVGGDIIKKEEYTPNNEIPKISITPSTLEYGVMEINNHTSQQITIKNLTENEITISELVLKHNNSFIKNKEEILPFILSKTGTKGEEKTITLTIQPTKIGYIKDTLYIGKSRNPVCPIQIEIPALVCPKIEIEPTAIQQFKAKGIKLTNLSNYKAVVTKIELIDTNKAFTIAPKINLPLTISPNSQSIDINIVFNPQAALRYEASIRIECYFEGIILPYQKEIKIVGIGK